MFSVSLPIAAFIARDVVRRQFEFKVRAR